MVFTKKLLIVSFIVTLLYLLLVVYTMNMSLINTVAIGSYPLGFKIKLFLLLLLGITTTMSTQNVILLVSNAILTGLVLSLTIEKIGMLRKMGNIHFVAGSSSVVAVVSGGCVSCGLPLLSLLGLSGSLVYLPFKGAELPYIALVLLLVSLSFLMQSKRKERLCEIPKKRKK